MIFVATSDGKLTNESSRRIELQGGPRLLTQRRRAPGLNVSINESNRSERAKGSTGSRSALILTGLALVSWK